MLYSLKNAYSKLKCLGVHARCASSYRVGEYYYQDTSTNIPSILDD